MQVALISKLTWEDVKEIFELLYDMTREHWIPDDDKEFYTEAIHRLNMKYNTLEACKERYKEILPVAEDIVGEKNRKERTFELVVLRSMVACKLREENFTISDIGRVMGYNHATVMHYFKKKEDFFLLPNMYEREVRWFKQFDERLNDDNDGDN